MSVGTVQWYNGTMVQLYNDTYGLCGTKPVDSDATPDYHSGAWCAVFPHWQAEMEDVMEEDVVGVVEEGVAANPTKAHRLLEFM